MQKSETRLRKKRRSLPVAYVLNNRIVTLLNFLDSDLQTPNGSQEVAGGLTLDNTVTPTTLRQLALRLDDLEPAEETTDLWDMEQGESACIDAGS